MRWRPPLDPADLASAMRDRYVKRDRFEDVIGNPVTCEGIRWPLRAFRAGRLGLGV
jgi:hypothetical protein